MPPDAQSPGGCPLCGGSSRRRLVTKRGCEVVRCMGCGLVFVWPPPAPGELEALYSSGQYHAELDEAERRRYFAQRLRQIEERVPQRGRILDVGCSKGFFLDIARAEGWDAVGVELNARAVEAALARGLNVRRGDLADQDLPEASFDVVTLFDLLEHTAQPQATLAACRRLLRPQGLLVVTTPNIDGLVPRVTYALFARTLGAWDHPTPPGHLVQFSRRTLQQMLSMQGFTIVHYRVEHIPFGYSVGKLENSVMDVLAGRHKRRAQPKPMDAKGLARVEAEARPRPGFGARRLVRYGVRGLSWAVIGATGLVARAIGWGDSMAVAARREG